MDRSAPNSPAPHNQINGSQDERTLQPTPPSVFPFPNVQMPAGAPQQVPHQPGYPPLQAHVLVDPVTGQHYIVPQAYYPPIQPMYYPPHQTNQPNQMYYQYPKQTPVPPQQQQPMYMGMPMYNMQGATGSRPEEKETHDDEMSTTPSSRNSFSLQNQKLGQFGRENSREYMYRSPTTNQQVEYDYPLRSPLGRPKYESPFNKMHHRVEMDQSRGGTQSDFEGRVTTKPSDRFNMSSSSDVESTRRSFRNDRPSTSEKTEPIPESVEYVEPKVEKKPIVPPSKSIRMEINFDDVPSMPTEAKPARRSNATAFTVNLDEKEKDLSLQEAARNLAENRRKIKLGKNVSLEKVEKIEPIANNKTNKNYLLEKLLTGKSSTSNSNEYVDNEGSEVGSSRAGGNDDSREFDARSEALTFVIDTSKRTNPGYYSQNQYQTRVVTYSDDDSSSDSEVMEQYSERSQKEAAPEVTRPTTIAASRLPAPQVSLLNTTTTQPSTSSKSTTPRSAGGGAGGSDFLQELAKLRLMAGLPASGIGGGGESTTTKAAPFRRSEVSSARAPTVSSSQKTVGSRASFNSRTRETAREASTTPIVSRRSETRRSLGGGNSSPQMSNRPPFRAGATTNAPPTTRGIMIGQSEQQREQERTAWLRRKDYNPMKAAAAGRKTTAEQQKNREQQFTSRRSMTFHSTNDPFSKGMPSTGGGSNMMTRPARNRSQEPRDINNDRYRVGGGQRRSDDGGKISGLAKAVDLLSKKCKKSIELIRQQNKGCLSVSVEDLLSAAAEPPRPNESLDDQLERLSDAFDAVQRYLEQYSLDGYGSPVPDSYYDDDAMESKSTFSGVSTHRNHESVNSESISSSYRKKVLDS